MATERTLSPPEVAQYLIRRFAEDGIGIGTGLRLLQRAADPSDPRMQEVIEEYRKLFQQYQNAKIEQMRRLRVAPAEAPWQWVKRPDGTLERVSVTPRVQPIPQPSLPALRPITEPIAISFEALGMGARDFAHTMLEPVPVNDKIKETVASAFEGFVKLAPAMMMGPFTLPFIGLTALSESAVYGEGAPGIVSSALGIKPNPFLAGAESALSMYIFGKFVGASQKAAQPLVTRMMTHIQHPSARVFARNAALANAGILAAGTYGAVETGVISGLHGEIPSRERLAESFLTYAFLDAFNRTMGTYIHSTTTEQRNREHLYVQSLNNLISRARNWRKSPPRPEEVADALELVSLLRPEDRRVLESYLRHQAPGVTDDMLKEVVRRRIEEARARAEAEASAPEEVSPPSPAPEAPPPPETRPAEAPPAEPTRPSVPPPPPAPPPPPPPLLPIEGKPPSEVGRLEEVLRNAEEAKRIVQEQGFAEERPYKSDVQEFVKDNPIAVPPARVVNEILGPPTDELTVRTYEGREVKVPVSDLPARNMGHIDRVFIQWPGTKRTLASSYPHIYENIAKWVREPLLARIKTPADIPQEAHIFVPFGGSGTDAIRVLLGIRNHTYRNHIKAVVHYNDINPGLVRLWQEFGAKPDEAMRRLEEAITPFIQWKTKKHVSDLMLPEEELLRLTDKLNSTLKTLDVSKPEDLFTAIYMVNAFYPHLIQKNIISRFDPSDPESVEKTEHLIDNLKQAIVTLSHPDDKQQFRQALWNAKSEYTRSYLAEKQYREILKDVVSGFEANYLDATAVIKAKLRRFQDMTGWLVILDPPYYQTAGYAVGKGYSDRIDLHLALADYATKMAQRGALVVLHNSDVALTANIEGVGTFLDALQQRGASVRLLTRPRPFGRKALEMLALFIPEHIQRRVEDSLTPPTTQPRPEPVAQPIAQPAPPEPARPTPSEVTPEPIPATVPPTESAIPPPPERPVKPEDPIQAASDFIQKTAGYIRLLQSYMRPGLPALAESLREEAKRAYESAFNYLLETIEKGKKKKEKHKRYIALADDLAVLMREANDMGVPVRPYYFGAEIPAMKTEALALAEQIKRLAPDAESDDVNIDTLLNRHKELVTTARYFLKIADATGIRDHTRDLLAILDTEADVRVALKRIGARQTAPFRGDIGLPAEAQDNPEVVVIASVGSGETRTSETYKAKLVVASLGSIMKSHRWSEDAIKRIQASIAEGKTPEVKEGDLQPDPDYPTVQARVDRLADAIRIAEHYHKDKVYRQALINDAPWLHEGIPVGIYDAKNDRFVTINNARLLAIDILPEATREILFNEIREYAEKNGIFMPDDIDDPVILRVLPEITPDQMRTLAAASNFAAVGQMNRFEEARTFASMPAWPALSDWAPDKAGNLANALFNVRYNGAVIKKVYDLLSAGSATLANRFFYPDTTRPNEAGETLIEDVIIVQAFGRYYKSSLKELLDTAMGPRATRQIREMLINLSQDVHQLQQTTSKPEFQRYDITPAIFEVLTHINNGLAKGWNIRQAILTRSLTEQYSTEATAMLDILAYGYSQDPAGLATALPFVIRAYTKGIPEMGVERETLHGKVPPADPLTLLLAANRMQDLLPALKKSPPPKTEIDIPPEPEPPEKPPESKPHEEAPPEAPPPKPPKPPRPPSRGKRKVKPPPSPELESQPEQTSTEQFAQISPSHKRMLDFWLKLKELGQIDNAGIYLLTEVFKLVPERLLSQLHYKLADLGISISGKFRPGPPPEIYIARVRDVSYMNRHVWTFLHEYAHYAYISVFGPEERKQIKTVLRKIIRANPDLTKTWFANMGYPITEEELRSGTGIEELFAELFAHWVFTGGPFHPQVERLLRKIHAELLSKLFRAYEATGTLNDLLASVQGEPVTMNHVIPYFERIIFAPESEDSQRQYIIPGPIKAMQSLAAKGIGMYHWPFTNVDRALIKEDPVEQVKYITPVRRKPVEPGQPIATNLQFGINFIDFRENRVVDLAKEHPEEYEQLKDIINYINASHKPPPPEPILVELIPGKIPMEPKKPQAESAPITEPEIRPPAPVEPSRRPKSEEIAEPEAEPEVVIEPILPRPQWSESLPEITLLVTDPFRDTEPEQTTRHYEAKPILFRKVGDTILPVYHNDPDAIAFWGTVQRLPDQNSVAYLTQFIRAFTTPTGREDYFVEYGTDKIARSRIEHAIEALRLAGIDIPDRERLIDAVEKGDFDYTNNLFHELGWNAIAGPEGMEIVAIPKQVVSASEFINYLRSLEIKKGKLLVNTPSGKGVIVELGRDMAYVQLVDPDTGKLLGHPLEFFLSQIEFPRGVHLVRVTREKKSTDIEQAGEEEEAKKGPWVTITKQGELEEVHWTDLLTQENILAAIEHMPENPTLFHREYKLPPYLNIGPVPQPKPEHAPESTRPQHQAEPVDYFSRIAELWDIPKDIVTRAYQASGLSGIPVEALKPIEWQQFYSAALTLAGIPEPARFRGLLGAVSRVLIGDRITGAPMEFVLQAPKTGKFVKQIVTQTENIVRDLLGKTVTKWEDLLVSSKGKDRVTLFKYLTNGEFFRLYRLGKPMPYPVLEHAREVVRQIFDEFAKASAEAQIYEQDPVTGRYRPFRPIENYLPITLTSEAIGVLFANSPTDPRNNALKRIVSFTGISTDWFVRKYIAPSRPFGSLEVSRVLDLASAIQRYNEEMRQRDPSYGNPPEGAIMVGGKPFQIIITDITKLVPNYMSRAASRIGIIKVFGQGVAGNPRKIDPQELYDQLAQENTDAAIAWRAIWDNLNHYTMTSREWTIARPFLDFIDGVRGIQLSMAWLWQPTGYIPIAEAFGVKQAAKAFLKTFMLEGKDELEILRLRNVWSRDVLPYTTMMQFAMEGRGARLSRVFIAHTPLNVLNRHINKTTALATAGWLRDLPFKGVNAGDEELMRDLLDFNDAQIDRAKRGALTDDDIAQAARRAVARINGFQESAGDIAPIYRHPFGRSVLAYTQWVRLMGRWAAHAVLQAQKGNYRPLAAVLFGTASSVALVYALRRTAYGRRKDDQLWNNLFFAIMDAQRLGIATDLASDIVFSVSRGENPMADLIAIPPLRGLGDMMLGTYFLLKKGKREKLIRSVPALRAIDTAYEEYVLGEEEDFDLPPDFKTPKSFATPESFARER